MAPNCRIAEHNGNLVRTTAVGRRPVVMVVEDDPHVRTLLEVCLEGAGYTVISARAVADALHLVDRVEPDAVVTGIHLPGLDGWQLVRRLRGDLGLASIPIVVFGERAHHGTRCEGNLADVHPVDPLAGTQAVAHLLGVLLRRPGAAMTQGGAAAETVPRPELQALGARRWDAAPDQALPHRSLPDSWVPPFG